MSTGGWQVLEFIVGDIYAGESSNVTDGIWDLRYLIVREVQYSQAGTVSDLKDCTRQTEYAVTIQIQLL